MGCGENSLSRTHKAGKKTLLSCVYRTSSKIQNGVIYRKEDIFLEPACLESLDIPNLCLQIDDH